MATSKKDSPQGTVTHLTDTQMRDLSYEELLAHATNNRRLDEVIGRHLIEDKHELEKKPFIITGIRFRPSDQSDTEYVSLEIKTADFGDAVLNDGSTGIRRQIMDYCMSKGWAELTEKGTAAQEDALSAGDLAVEYFDWSLPATLYYLDTGEATVRIDGVFLHAPRGLRVSNYDWKDPSDGKVKKASTFYLA